VSNICSVFHYLNTPYGVRAVSLQVIVTPHSAFLTHEALGNIAVTTVSNMEEFLLNKPLTNEIKLKPRAIKPAR
jgi:lactate dehydrogenase-like 2-hydroxyacid dehydrogenase